MDEKYRTIIGGRSRGSRLTGDYPRSIEILLKKAKVDDSFREYLLQDPKRAAESIEMVLDPGELKVLQSIPGILLEKIIDSTSIMQQNVPAFRTATKAAALLLLLGTTAVVPAVAGTGVEEPAGYTEVQYDLARERMAAVQRALDAYKARYGRYPSTREWEENVNPLEGFAVNSDLFDPWHRKYHYEEYKEGGEIVGYRLESYGLDMISPVDNVPCPLDTDEHLFLEEPPLWIRYPGVGQTVASGTSALFKAEHLSPKVLIDWYLDDQKIGQTVSKNELAVYLKPGEHTLLLLDENGYTAKVDFTAGSGDSE